MSLHTLGDSVLLKILTYVDPKPRLYMNVAATCRRLHVDLTSQFALELDFWRFVVVRHPAKFPQFPQFASRDHQVALEAVRGDGLMLEHCSDDLKVDWDLATAACAQKAEAAKFVGLPLLFDDESPHNNHGSFDYAVVPLEYRNNLAVVWAALVAGVFRALPDHSRNVQRVTATTFNLDDVRDDLERRQAVTGFFLWADSRGQPSVQLCRWQHVALREPDKERAGASNCLWSTIY